MATTFSATVDARVLPIPQKHPTIFRTFEGLGVGEAMLLVNDHDPKPLYYQFAAERTGQFEWRYLENGPEVWKVEIRRVDAATAVQAPAEALGCCGHAAGGDPGHTEHHAHAGPPTQVLKDEHALILEALDALEHKISALEAGAVPDRAYFEKAVEFLRTFADRCHHGKEENLLFRTMVDRGFPLQGGPIAVMLAEHDTGRALIRGIADGAAGLEKDPGATQQIIQNGRGYIRLLREHIDKENTILFPMADNILSPEDQEHLEREFERFEAEETGAGVREASLKLLEELTAGAQ
jgi:hemerythrin-like domain-containing protein